MDTFSFFPFEWTEKTQPIQEVQRHELQAWGYKRNADGSEVPSMIRIRDFPVSCELQLPHRMGGLTVTWTKPLVQQLLRAYKNVVDERIRWNNENYPEYAKRIPQIVDTVIHRSREFYYYQTQLHTFVRVSFYTMEDLYAYLQPIKNKEGEYAKVVDIPHFHGKLREKVYLRAWQERIETVKKMMARQHSTYTGWHQMTGTAVPSSIKLAHDIYPEYIVSSSSIQKLEDSRVPSVKLMSFDIETYSHEVGHFPDPHTIEDVVHMISCITEEYGKPETRSKTLLTIGSCPIQDASIRIWECSDEEDLLVSLGRHIEEMDPDILTGYNTLQFDWNYVRIRAIKNLLWDRVWDACSRLKDVPCWHQREACRSCCRSYLKKKEMNSSGRGENTFYGIKIKGRLSLVDMLVIMKADVKERYYNLGYISEKYLGEGETKHDMTVRDMFAIWEGHQATMKTPENPDASFWARKEHFDREYARFGSYCVQDSVLVNKLFHAQSTWSWLCSQAEMYGVNPENVYLYGQQARGVSLFFNQCHQDNVVMTRRPKVAGAYKGGYVSQPIKGLHDLVFCVDYNSLYPNTARRYNIDFTTLLKEDDANRLLYHIANERGCSNYETREDLIGKLLETVEEQGKIEHELYEIAIWEEKVEKEVREEVDGKMKKRKEMETKRYCFVYRKPEWKTRSDGTRYVQRGVFPSLAERLILERKDIKRQMKTLSEDDPAYRVMDMKQLVIKMATNSLYGMMGSKDSPFSLFEGAMSITAWGRQNIIETGKHLEARYQEEGARVVYGDTDSVMIQMRNLRGKTDDPIHNRMLLESRRQEFEDAANEINVEPMHVEYEKGMWMALFGKKMYAYYMFTSDGSFVMNSKPETRGRFQGETMPKMFAKGIPLARREDCYFKLDVYEAALRLVLRGATRQELHEVFRTYVQRLITMDIDPDDLVSVSAIASEYADDGNKLKIFSDRRSDMGKPVVGGEKIKMITVIPPYKEPPYKLKVGPKLRGYDEFLENRGTDQALPFDYFKYVETLKRTEEIYNLVDPEDIQARIRTHQASREQELKEAIRISLFYVIGEPARRIYEVLEDKDQLPLAIQSKPALRAKTKVQHVLREVRKRSKIKRGWDLREDGHPVQQIYQGLIVRDQLHRELLDLDLASRCEPGCEKDYGNVLRTRTLYGYPVHLWITSLSQPGSRRKPSTIPERFLDKPEGGHVEYIVRRK